MCYIVSIIRYYSQQQNECTVLLQNDIVRIVAFAEYSI